MADGAGDYKSSTEQEACVGRAIRFGYGLFAVSFGLAYFAQQYALRKSIPVKYRILFPSAVAIVLSYAETRRRVGLCRYR